MSDLKKYTKKRLSSDVAFRDGFEDGFEKFRIGVMLKQARLDAGLTQGQVASAIGIQKASISQLENHTEDVKLSTLEKYVKALGKKIEIRIA